MIYLLQLIDIKHKRKDKKQNKNKKWRFYNYIRADSKVPGMYMNRFKKINSI